MFKKKIFLFILYIDLTYVSQIFFYMYAILFYLGVGNASLMLFMWDEDTIPQAYLCPGLTKGTFRRDFH